MKTANAKPNILIPNFTMNQPSDMIKIHEGEFILTTKEGDNVIKGVIQIIWKPHVALYFAGQSKIYYERDASFNIEINVSVENFPLGECKILLQRYDTNINEGYIEGVIPEPLVFGTTTYGVDSIIFQVFNLKMMIRDNYTFDFKDLKITITKQAKIDKKLQDLKNHRGFLSLYDGEIISKTGSKLKISNIEKGLECLHDFISFINGRVCGILFKQGKTENNIIWTDLDVRRSGQEYEFTHTVIPIHKDFSIEELWNEFVKLWLQDTDKPFLLDAIDWYIQAHMNSLALRTRIITVQAGLELMFNWLILEKIKLIVNDEGTNLTAANKIRVIAYVCRANLDIPNTYFDLFQFSISNPKVKLDGAACLVTLRNSFVHGEKSKAINISKLTSPAAFQTVWLGLWYLELALLFILDYKGIYYNRTANWEDARPETEMTVPWI